MTIHYRQHGSVLIVFGNTYAFRDQIKALGGRFNGGEKTWRIPLSDAALTSISALCAGAGGGLLGVAEAQPSLGAAAERTASVVAALFPGAALAAPAPAAGPFALTGLGRGGDGDSLTVRQLMERLSQAVANAFPVALWVTGEVQNLTRRASGVFFDLAEGRAGTHASATVTARAIIWSGALQAMTGRHGAERLTDVLQDGMQLRCRCQVQLYKDRGSVTLVVEDVDPAYTKGALALAREALLKELRAKGLDLANKRLTLPPLPFCVGLISAAGSRAMSDFLDQLQVTGFPGNVLVCGTPMQGEGVPQAVAAALTRLAAAGCDLIVVTRGGGSAADLRWFDAAEIAYAIATCPVPVVAAIGHHDDVCVAEEICHLRQKTPTAAADFVAGCFVRTRELIESLAAQLANILARRVEELGLITAAQAERLAHGATQALTARAGRLATLGAGLERGAALRLASGGAALEAREHHVQRGAAERLSAGRGALEALEHALLRGAAGRLSLGREAVELARHALERGGAVLLAGGRHQLDGRASALAVATERALAAVGVRLASAEGKLGGHDPKPWLEQGWTQLTGRGGRIRRAVEVEVGEALTARLADGWLALAVTGKARPVAAAAGLDKDPNVREQTPQPGAAGDVAAEEVHRE